jgi:predicted esterase
MFMDGYGAGLIKTLARERGAVLATPRTGAFSGAGGAEAFDALLETLRTDYRIDPKRVFVLGHSMGGMATNALLASRGGKIAAGACLCGFQGFAEGTSGIPPVLIVAGEIDPIVSPARIEPAFRKAKAAGLPVEYRLIANYGHTLTVAKVLPDAVAWLFARSRS